MMILLYCTMSTYDMITSLCMRLGLYLLVALRSFPYLGSYVLEFVNNQTQPVGKTGGDTFPHSFAPPLSFRVVLMAFENFKYPWDAQASTLLLFCLLDGLQVLFRVKQVFKNIVQRPAPGLDSCEWLGVWDSMGTYLGQWAPPMFFELTPEQAQQAVTAPRPAPPLPLPLALSRLPRRARQLLQLQLQPQLQLQASRLSPMTNLCR